MQQNASTSNNKVKNLLSEFTTDWEFPALGKKHITIYNGSTKISLRASLTG